MCSGTPEEIIFLHLQVWHRCPYFKVAQHIQPSIPPVHWGSKQTGPGVSIGISIRISAFTHSHPHRWLYTSLGTLGWEIHGCVLRRPYPDVNRCLIQNGHFVDSLSTDRALVENKQVRRIYRILLDQAGENTSSAIGLFTSTNRIILEYSNTHTKESNGSAETHIQ